MKLPKVTCKGCRTATQLGPGADVTVIIYRNCPWFSGFMWECRNCRSCQHEFFESWGKQSKKLTKLLCASAQDVVKLRTATRFVARDYKRTFGVRMPVPRDPHIPHKVKEFRQQLEELQNVDHFRALS